MVAIGKLSPVQRYRDIAKPNQLIHHLRILRSYSHESFEIHRDLEEDPHFQGRILDKGLVDDGMTLLNLDLDIRHF